MSTTTTALSDNDDHFSPYRSDGKLYGFVCIVTSATEPIGKAVVRELAAHGAACVYACTIQISNEATTLAQDVQNEFPNTKVIGYPGHLFTEEATLTLIDDVLNSWGRLDIYTSTPSLTGPTSLTATTPADLSMLIAQHTLSPFFALKYAPPAMAKTTPRGPYPNAAPKTTAYGSIIVVTSLASTTGGAASGPALTVASHAALGVVKAGVAALKGSAVRINAVSHGAIDVEEDGKVVEVGGLGRKGTPMEVARVVGFLASGFSSYMTGANVVVDGGSSVLGAL